MREEFQQIVGDLWWWLFEVRMCVCLCVCVCVQPSSFCAIGFKFGLENEFCYISFVLSLSISSSLSYCDLVAWIKW